MSKKEQVKSKKTVEGEQLKLAVREICNKNDHRRTKMKKNLQKNAQIHCSSMINLQFNQE